MSPRHPDRVDLVTALAAFAALNALAWVGSLRLADHMLQLGLSSMLLGIVATVTALAVPIAVGASRTMTD